MRESLTLWVQFALNELSHTSQIIFSIHGIKSSKIIPLKFLILGCKYETRNFLYFMFAPPVGNLIWAFMGFCSVFEICASKKESGHTQNWLFYWTKKNIWKHPRSYLIDCPNTIRYNLASYLQHLDEMTTAWLWYWIAFSSLSRVVVFSDSHEFFF